MAKKKKQKAKKEEVAKEKSNNGRNRTDLFVKTLPYLITSLGLFIGLFQFSYNEYVQDIRRNEIVYFDEKYSILKRTAQILSKIDTKLSININEDESIDSLAMLAKKLNESFYYSYLFLDTTGVDCKLGKQLAKSNDYLKKIIRSEASKSDNEDILNELENLSNYNNASDSTIQLIGKVLKNEKDKFNTFNYSDFFRSLF